MTHREISGKLNDLSNELLFLAKDDFFQGDEVSPLAKVLKDFLENTSYTLDRFADGVEAENPEEGE